MKPKPHTTQYVPTTVTLCPFYSRLGAPHIQSAVVDRLLYTQWTSEWINLHNAWKMNETGVFIPTIPDTVYICWSVFFFITFQHLEWNPGVFQICWSSCCSYSDIGIKFCQLFRHPQNWRYSSASQHEIPVLLTNLRIHFQKFENFISQHLKISFPVWYSSLYSQLFLTLYRKTNTTKHIFAVTPLVTVGTIWLKFLFSKAQRV